MKINCYLGITVSLLAFFCTLLIFTRTSNFIVLPENKEKNNKLLENNKVFNVYQDDSRYVYPYEPPVNPITGLSKIVDIISPSPDLYTPFNNFYDINDSEYSILENPGLNELNYSGGSTKLIKIPLQMNAPNEYEQLRSQNVLITPYNKNKYC